MKVTLSSAEIRGYRTRRGWFTLHLKTVMLVDGGWNFGNSHIDSLSVGVLLPGRDRIDFECSVAVDADYPFDGEISAHTLYLVARNVVERIEPSVVTLLLDLRLDVGVRVVHQQLGTLRRMS